MRLTRKNLALFNKMGRKKGTKTSVMLRLVSLKPPTNLKDIREWDVRSYDTASPTESVYRRYVNRIAKAPIEATVAFKVGGRVLKEYDEFNRVFTGVLKDLGYNCLLRSLVLLRGLRCENSARSG